jgi:toxin ParE1/3/4
MGRIIWACRAADQLEALVDFIAKGSPREARRFAARVLRRIATLGTHPELGGWVIEDETRTYRELLLGNYRIIYRTEPEVIYIVAVRHSARLWDVKDVS